MIGLFLGDTDFPKIVLKKIKKLKKKYFIIDFSKNNLFAKEKNSYRISIGKSPTIGGTDHISHRLLAKGFSEKKVLSIFLSY